MGNWVASGTQPVSYQGAAARTYTKLTMTDPDTGVVATITGESASKSGELAQALSGGKKIVVCTIQTFPKALEKAREMAATKGRRFVVIADEAHSSQTGEAAAKLKQLGAKSAFLGYHGYPAVLCTSVNDEGVHGIPGDRRLGQCVHGGFQGKGKQAGPFLPVHRIQRIQAERVAKMDQGLRIFFIPKRVFKCQGEQGNGPW